MKLSDKTTAHILVKANTNSEWDNCEFAIIHLSEEWKKEQVKRLALVKPLEGNHYFCSMNYYDTAVDFYRTGEDDNPNIEELLNGKEWVFVELDEQEQETFTVPENRLDCYRLVQNAQKGTAQNEPLWKRPNWFTDHFFDGHNSIFAIHCLIEYTEDAQCNLQLKQTIHLLFGTDKFLQITLNDK